MCGESTQLRRSFGPRRAARTLSGRRGGFRRFGRPPFVAYLPIRPPLHLPPPPRPLLRPATHAQGGWFRVEVDAAEDIGEHQPLRRTVSFMPKVVWQVDYGRGYNYKLKRLVEVRRRREAHSLLEGFVRRRQGGRRPAARHAHGHCLHS